MPYLKRISSGAVSAFLDEGSVLYETLADTHDVNNKALFEDVPEEIANAAASRFVAIIDPGAATAADETAVADARLPGRAGTITAAEFFANAAITGVATNNRTITAQQPAVSGTATPTRAVTNLASVVFNAGVNATPGAPVAMTINNAAFVGDNPIEVTSVHGGTGLADPGGVVVLTYTPA